MIRRQFSTPGASKAPPAARYKNSSSDTAMTTMPATRP